MLSHRSLRQAYLYSVPTPGRYALCALPAALIAFMAWSVIAGSYSAGLAPACAFLVWLIGMQCGALALLRRGIIDNYSFVLLHCGLAFGVLWFLSSNYGAYANDYTGHAKYILHLVTHYTLPDPYGWQTQQPPLYYIAGALVWKFGALLGAPEPMEAVRVLSLSLYAGYLVLAMMTLTRLLPAGPVRMLACAIVAFWPEGINMMPRLNNDVPLVFFQAACLYALTVWHQQRSPKFLAIAVGSAVLATATKSTAVILWGAIALTLAAEWVLERKPPFTTNLLRHRVFLCGLLPAAILALASGFGRIWYFRTVYAQDIQWFMNVKTEEVQQWLGQNLPYNYLYFDYLAFLREPFYRSGAKIGHDYFWNTFLQTLLFGEWTWGLPVLASTMSTLMLVLIAYAASLLFVRARHDTSLLPAAAMLVCMIGAMICARITLPWSAQCNGRYVFAVITILALFYGTALARLHAGGRALLYYAGAGAGILFFAGSLILMAEWLTNA